jgi:hypothetical protein
MEDLAECKAGNIIAKLIPPAYQPKSRDVILPENLKFRGMDHVQIESKYASFIGDDGCVYFVLHPDNESLSHLSLLSPLGSMPKVFVLPWMVECLLQNHFQCSHLERANLLISVSLLCDIEVKRFAAAAWRSPSVPPSYGAALHWYHWMLSSNERSVAVYVGTDGWYSPKGTLSVAGCALSGALQDDGTLAAAFCYVGPNQCCQTIHLKFASVEAFSLQGIALRGC